MRTCFSLPPALYQLPVMSLATCRQDTGTQTTESGQGFASSLWQLDSERLAQRMHCSYLHAQWQLCMVCMQELLSAGLGNHQLQHAAHLQRLLRSTAWASSSSYLPSGLVHGGGLLHLTEIPCCIGTCTWHTRAMGVQKLCKGWDEYAH